jgi:SAM-dependent methyltransferase
MILDHSFFESLWSTNLEFDIKSRIDAYSLDCKFLNSEQEDDLLSIINKEIDAGSFSRSGPHRISAWEGGWGENLFEYSVTRNQEFLIPKYFGKSSVHRINRHFVISNDREFELKLLRIIQLRVFSKYLRDAGAIYEFGCGTGHNLLYFNTLYPGRRLIGLDWSQTSQKIIESVRTDQDLKNLEGFRFDFFNPDLNLKLSPKSPVLTVASLEQSGQNFEAFLDYLISQGSRRIVHIEPFHEVLDSNHKLDVQSISYMKARNYISGYIASIKALEVKKRARILELARSFVGSKYIDGYTTMVWEILE